MQRVDCKSNENDLLRDWPRHTKTERRKQVTMEAEMGVMQPQAKTSWDGESCGGRWWPTTNIQ